MKKRILVGFCACLLLFSGCRSVDEIIRGEPGGRASENADSISSSSRPTPSTSSASPDADSTSNPSPSSVITSSSEPSIIKVVVPEGYTLPKIGMLLEEKKICTAEQFVEAAQNGDYSNYSFIANQSSGTNRCFRLEGYLFPDTYEIYTSETPEEIIRRMLSNTEQRLASVLSTVQNSGYTLDQLITLASIIEKEALGHDQMRGISSVLQNRLNQGMKLECDVTINYVEYVIKPFISGDKNRFNSDYNTYKCSALPAGAICNPGIDAIQAALNPDSTNYLFFLTKDGQLYLSETFEAHKDLCKRLGIQ